MIRKNKKPKNRQTYQFQVLIEVDEDGKYVASCPALEACYTQGDTFEEALENIQEVIALCLDEMRAEKKEFNPRYPELVGIKNIEVTL